MKSMRLPIALALLALTLMCMPSAHAATTSNAAQTTMSSAYQKTPQHAAGFLDDLIDWIRDRRQTQAPEMPNVTGKLAAAFLGFLGYLAIRRRYAFNPQA